MCTGVMICLQRCNDGAKCVVTMLTAAMPYKGEPPLCIPFWVCAARVAKHPNSSHLGGKGGQSLEPCFTAGLITVSTAWDRGGTWTLAGCWAARSTA